MKAVESVRQLKAAAIVGRDAVLDDLHFEMSMASDPIKEATCALALGLVLSVFLAGCGTDRKAPSRRATPTSRCNGRACRDATARRSGVVSEARGANLWLSTAGGSCVRQSAPRGEVSPEDCGSLEAAYVAAQCGDVVYIDAGTYSAEQDLAAKASLDSCSAPVVFKAAPGVSQSSIVFDSVYSGNNAQANTNGASNWTLQGVTVKTMIELYPPTRNVTINDVQGGTLTISATNNVTVENSNWGPCYNVISLASGQTDNGATGPTYSPNPAITCNSNIKIMGIWTQASGSINHLRGLHFKHNVVHDFIDDNSNEATDHFECMFIDGGADITVDSNKFYDCQIYSIFLQPFSGYPIRNLTIQNNWFWATQNNSGTCKSNDCSPAGPARPSALDFGEETASDVTNVLVRFNSFDPANGIQVDGIPPGSGSDVRFIGNIVGNSGYKPCISGASYGYNIWQTQDMTTPQSCGASDEKVGSSLYARSGKSGDTTLDDLNLVCNSDAKDFVKPNGSNYQLDYDIDGSARATNGPRSAGSQEGTC